jgi:hypothetical protein
MDQVKIQLKKLKGLVVEVEDVRFFERQSAMLSSFNISLNRLGYNMSSELLNALRTKSVPFIIDLHAKVKTTLKEIKGVHVTSKAFYPNFPGQVMETRETDLYLNAFLHYVTWGQWLPEFNEETREELNIPNETFEEIGLVSRKDYNKIFTSILSSKISVSEEDREIVDFFLKKESELVFPDEIPFKETLAIVGSHFLKSKKPIKGLINNATDVLRIMNYFSIQDSSLTQEFRLVSFPRATRRLIIEALEEVANVEDLLRHKTKWTRAFHCLHVGDYSTKLYEMASVVRDKVKVETFNSQVEALILDKKVARVTELLQSRPSEFARRVLHLMSLDQRSTGTIASKFSAVIDKVPTRILAQLYGETLSRQTGPDHFMVPLRGQGNALKRVEKVRKVLSENIYTSLRNLIETSLKSRFSGLGNLGKTWIDPALKNCPLPLQQRDSSSGTFSVERGTKVPLEGAENTLRFLVYWKGEDIDLSALLLKEDADLSKSQHISYTDLKHSYGCHSGDIIDGSAGASEYIDINMNLALFAGFRYVAMSVYVFSGPTFKKHSTCFAGFMMRNNPQTGDILDPRTVKYKFNLTSETSSTIPLLFDLKTKEVVFIDSAMLKVRGYRNIENHKSEMSDFIEYMLTTKNKMKLYDLFRIHAQSRGELVEDRENAETVFSLDEGITPFDVNLISSEFMI